MSQKWASPKYLGFNQTEVARRISELVGRRDAEAEARNAVTTTNVAQLSAEDRIRFGFEDDWKPIPAKPWTPGQKRQTKRP